MTQSLNDPTSRQTPTSILVDRFLGNRFSEWIKVLAVLLTIIGMVVTITVWANNSHAEIKSWTSEQDYVTKTELKDTMKEQYVPLHEFTKVQQSLKDQKEDLQKIEKKLDQVLEKL